MAAKRKVKTVAVYARRSQKDEAKGSVPTQLRKCRELAATEGWHVREFKDDGVSGWNPKVTRDEYEKMLDAIRENEIDAVVVRTADRITRQDDERAEFERIYSAAGLRMVYLADGTSFDLGTAQGRRSFREAGTASAFYSDSLSEKIRDVVDEIAEGGWWSGGGAPFGYRVVQDGEHKSLAIVEDQAEALRRCYEGVLNRRSQRALARELNAGGFTTARGNPWNGNTLTQTLIAGRNAGLRERDGQVIGNARWRPIVDKRTWQRVKDRLTAEDRKNFRSRGGRYPLTGTVFCKEHGAPMSGRPVNGVRKYVCGAGPEGGRMHLGVDAEKLEKHVGDMASIALGAKGVRVRDPGELPEELLARRDEIDERISTWNRNAAQAGLPPDEIRDGRAELVRERAEVEREIEDLATQETNDELIFEGDERWRAWVALRVERVNVRSVGRGAGRWTKVEDRIEIIWRDGVRPATYEEIVEEEARLGAEAAAKAGVNIDEWWAERVKARQK